MNYSDSLYHLAMAKTKTKEIAEDIVQDTFIKLFQSEKEFESKEHIKAWLIRVTINACNKYYKSSWYTKTVAYEEQAGEVSMMEEKSEVYYAILELPDKYREVLHLYYYEELSVKEIASIMNMKAVSIETRIHRARALLKKKLKGEYEYA